MLHVDVKWNDTVYSELTAGVQPVEHLEEESQALELIDRVVEWSRKGDLRTARQQLERLREVAPRTRDWRQIVEFMDARLLGLEKRDRKALALLNRMLSTDSRLLRTSEYRSIYEDVISEKASILLNLNRFQDAYPLLIEALEFDRDDLRGDVRANLGICLYRMRQHDEAESYLVQALDQSLQSDMRAAVHHYLGMILTKREAYARAKSEFEKSLESDPRGYDPRVFAWLALACEKLGMLEDAESYKRREPIWSRARRVLGRLIYRRRDS